MAVLTDYKGLDVVEGAIADGGAAITDDFKKLADRSPQKANVDPAANDDESSGYFTGSLWLNTLTNTLFMCVNPTEDAAVWKSLFSRDTSALQLVPEADGNVSIAGSVGIGTASPVARLDVRGTSMVIRSDVLGNDVLLAFQNSDGTIIGSAWTNNQLKLQLNGYDSNGVHVPVGLSIGNAFVSTVPPSGGALISGKLGVGVALPATNLHTGGSTILGVASSAESTGSLGAGQVNLWVDEANNLLTFKVKYSDGSTVKTGTMALT